MEGNYEGRGAWLPGVVEKVWKDGTMDILYDSGKWGRRVRAAAVRPLKQKAEQGGGVG